MKVKDCVPEYMKDSFIRQVLNMELEELAKFDFLKFDNPNWIYRGEYDESHMKRFYNICQNIYMLDNILKDHGYHFKIDIRQYMKYVEKLKNKEASRTDPFNFVNDHHIELFDLFNLRMKDMWWETRGNSARVKWPYNFINKTIFGHSVPETIQEIYYTLLVHELGDLHRDIAISYVLDKAVSDFDKDLIYMMYKDQWDEEEIIKFSKENYNKIFTEESLDSYMYCVYAKVRPYYKYFFKGLEGMRDEEKKAEEAKKILALSKYDEAKKLLDTMSISLKEENYLNQFDAEKKALDTIVEQLHYETLKDLFINPVSKITDLKGFGGKKNKKVMFLDACCRNYYKFNLPENDKQVSQNRMIIAQAEKRIEEYKG